MEFIIFILVICIFILFNNFYNLKKETSFIKSIVEKYREETSTLKRELAELKKSIEGKTITTEPVSYTHLDVYKRQQVYWRYLINKIYIFVIIANHDKSRTTFKRN